MLSVATILFTASCSGSEGPEGPKGEQGAQGIPGKDGAVIHSGTGAPAASLGNIAAISDRTNPQAILRP